MTVEHLAILGIAVFGFMAVANMFSALRTLKRSRSFKNIRIRRLIGGPDAAMAVARSVVQDAANSHVEEVRKARETGQLPEALEKALERGRAYYLSRVESIHRELFSAAIEEIIMQPADHTDTIQG